MWTLPFSLALCRQALFVTLHGLDGFLDSYSLNAYPKIFINSIWKIVSFHANISIRKEKGLCNLPVYVFCLLCEISAKVYGDWLAFSAQICPRKQPESGMMIKLLLPQALPSLIPEFCIVLLISYSKSKRIFVAIFILSVECLV